MVANSTAAGSRSGGLSLLEDARPSTGDAVSDDVVLARSDVSAWGRFAGIATAVLTVAIAPEARSLTFTPKFAVVLVIGAVGLVPFLRSVRLSRAGLPSLLLLGFVVTALVSSATSIAPVMSVVGLYTWGTGSLLWVGCAGAYGIGLKLRSAGDRDLLFAGLVTGAAVNAALALYQTLAQPSSAAFGPYQGNQAQGLVGNPIYLEALLLGTIALVLVRVSRSGASRWRFVPLLVLMAMALEFSDERFAVLVLPVILLGVLAWRRKAAVAGALAVAMGYLGGYVVAGSGLSSRLAVGTSSVGFGDRLRIWRIGIQAFLTRPLLGYGPGLFEAATSRRMTARLARDLGPTSLFTDGHNIVIELAVTTGVIGLLLFVGWLLTALFRLRNYLVLFALCALAVESIEPRSLAISPLVFLFIAAGQWRGSGEPSHAARGAAHPFSAVDRKLPVPLRVVTACLVAVALLFGATLLLGDFYLGKSPPDGYVLSDAKRANMLLPYWPQSAQALGTLYDYRGITATRFSRTARRNLRLAIAQFETATRRDSFDPLVYAGLGNAEAELRQWRAAERSYREGLRRDPWSQANLAGLGTAYAHRGQWMAAAAEFRLEFQALRPGFQRSSTERCLRAVEHHRLPSGPIA